MKPVVFNIACFLFLALFSNIGSSEEYLIFASAKYSESPSLKKFVEFRSSDFDVAIVEAESVGNSAEEFRAFVKNADPDYVLLIGSKIDFPAYAHDYPGGLIESYNYYVAEFAEGLPDPKIPIGLFFIDNESELNNAVNKTIAAERNLAQTPKKFYAHAGSREALPPWPVEFNEEILTEMYDKYFAREGYLFRLETAYDDTPNDAPADVRAFNNGIKYLFYHGHGNISKWSFGMGVDQIDYLQNETYPFVFSFSCLTGTFGGKIGDRVSPCFAEEIIAAERGACAFFGAYNKSGRGQNLLLEGLCEALAGDEVERIGDAILRAFRNDVPPETVEKYYQIVTNVERIRSFRQFHLFGDPALKFKNKSVDGLTATQAIDDPELSIYPNPASDFIEIKPPEGFKPSEGRNLEIADMEGIVVLKEKIHLIDHICRINIQSLPAGAYLLKIVSGRESYTGKFVVER